MDTELDALPKELPELLVVNNSFISMNLSISACSLVSAASSPSNCLTSSWSGGDFDVAFSVASDCASAYRWPIVLWINPLTFRKDARRSELHTW